MADQRNLSSVSHQEQLIEQLRDWWDHRPDEMDSTFGLYRLANMAADDLERLRRQVEFMEAFSADITINGRPWRELFDALNALVSDPVREACDG